MASRRKRRGAVVSLFPFLSILSCVIGTLTLIIAGLAVGEINDPESSAVAASEIEAGNRALEERERDLRRKRAEGEEKRRDLERKLGEARREKTDLDRRGKALEGERERRGRLRGELARAGKEAGELGEARDRRRAELGEIQGRIAERRRTRQKAEDAVSIVLPRGRKRDLEPSFIECTRTGLTLDVDRPPAERESISRSSIGGSSILQRYLAGRPKGGRGIVEFLVRPGGVKSFELARRVARSEKARFGYVPVPGLKSMDFSEIKAPGARGGR